MNVEITRVGTEERATCSSLDVAETFGKLHKNVIRDIQNLDCSEKFNRLNFELIKYIDSRGREQPYYLMTRDGFVFLVMGYTGEKAAQFKEAYIEQFNRMERELRWKQADREALELVRCVLTGILSEKSAPSEQQSKLKKREKTSPTDDETLLKAVSELVSATETHSWKGTATELANALNMTEKPHALTRKLNVLQGRLLEEYNVYYETARNRKGRYIELIYSPPAPLKLEIKTPLKAAKTTKIRK